MATGTFRAMGAMYGPIMPVMKNMGTKEMITAKVARMMGGLTSLTAWSTAMKGSCSLMAKCLWMFSTSTMGSSTTRPRDRIRAKSVTRLMV